MEMQRKIGAGGAGETLQGRKGVKGFFLVGQQKVLRGFGLRNGDHSSNTDDGAENQGRPASPAQINGKNRRLPEPWTSILFLRYGTLDWPYWAKGMCCNRLRPGRLTLVSGRWKKIHRVHGDA